MHLDRLITTTTRAAAAYGSSTRSTMTSLFFIVFIFCLNTQPTISIKRHPTRTTKSGLIINNNIIQKSSINPTIHTITRGGSDSDDGSEDDDENEISVEESSASTSSSIIETVVIKVFELVKKGTIITAKAIERSLKAATIEIQKEEDDDLSIVTKVTNILLSMWNAAIHGPDDKKKTTLSEKVEVVGDLGKYLSSEYNVPDNRIENCTDMLSGTIGDASIQARTMARLLVVFIPSNKDDDADCGIVRSLLSSDVSRIGEKKSRKKATTGSFLFWSAEYGSSDAKEAMKRLKAKQPAGKKQRRPVLLVAYPARIINTNTGIPQIVPRVVAQHHCSPPPLDMSKWLNALRKRHGSKEYASMLHDVRETHLLQERMMGYKESVRNDEERKEKVQQEERERIALEQQQKEHEKRIQERRLELKESLPEEPAKKPSDKNIMTIALRFVADGRVGQRRFESDTELEVVFNWIDAMYDIERETVTLQTMNGQKTFEWDSTDRNKTLKDVEFKRMTGLRVMIQEKKKDENADKDPDKDDDDTKDDDKDSDDEE
mmetsp:Transcript_21187/g.24179  ORF Transcript_21187/g.24179 Transcript_21187/m.24179 type:complete len:546 (-) Transcript_21187:97-1734(-)